MKKALLTLLVIAPAGVYAQSFNFSQIVNWTGTGSNEAALLIDWNDGSTDQALVWGYKWNGTATGEQMLDAIVAADKDLTQQYQSYSFGDFVTGLSFDGSAYGASGPGSHSQVGDGSSGSAGFWSYYTGSGTTYPSWTESNDGYSARALTNDSWDGWSFAVGDNDVAPSHQPVAAPVPAPEPFTVAGLGIGALALLRRKRA